jgi:pre-mRNA-splicing factor 38A
VYAYFFTLSILLTHTLILAGFSLTYMDEFVDKLLHEERVCDIILPRLPKREVLEETEGLPPRKSALMDAMEDKQSVSSRGGGHSRSKSGSPRQSRSRSRSKSISRSPSLVPSGDGDGGGDRYISRSPSRSRSRSRSPSLVQMDTTA